MAIENVLLEVRAIAGDARREIGSLARDLGAFGAISASATADINIAGARAKLTLLENQLKKIDREDVGVDINVHIGEALVELQLLKRELRKAELEGVDIHTRQGLIADIAGVERTVSSLVKSLGTAEKAGGRFAGILDRFGKAGTGSRVFAAISKNIGDIVRQFPVVGTLISEVGQSILSFGGKSSSALVSVAASAAAAGVAIVGFILVINYLITLLSAIIALLAALVASLALAAAGFAALATGVLAAAGPAILLLILLFQRFAAVLQARQARETALKQAARDRNQEELKNIQTQERLRSAHQAVIQAQQGLADSNENLKDTFKQGMQEMEDAAQGVRDALLGVEDAELGVAEARLGIREAEFELRKFRRETQLTGLDWQDLLKKAENVDFNPEKLKGLLQNVKGKGGKSPDEEQQLRLERLILNVRRAKLQEKQSNNTLTTSETTLTRARQKNNEFIQRGIKAYKPYAAAIKAVRNSENQLNEALHNQQITQKEIRIEATQSTSAMAEYQRQRSKLTKTEQDFLDNLNGVLGGLKKLGRALTDPIFRAANGVLSGLKGSSGQLKDALQGVGEAFGDWVKEFGKFLSEPQTRSAFQVMARGAGALIRNLGGKALTDFFRILRNVAVAVMPNVIRKSESIARTFKRWADGTSNLVDLRKKLRPLIREFDTWWDIIKLLAEDFIAFVKDAQGPAHSISTSIRNWLINLRKFLQSKHGREEIRQWIEDAKDTAVDFWHALRTIAHWIRIMGDFAKDALGPLGKLLELLDKGRDLWDKVPDILKVGPDILKGPSPLYTLGKKLKLWHQGGVHDYTGPYIGQQGEYTVRSSVVAQMGIPFMDAFNRGAIGPALAALAAPVTTVSRGDVNIDRVEVSAPDGGYPDGRHAAAVLARELRRLGG